jgi:hypothetical protein
MRFMRDAPITSADSAHHSNGNGFVRAQRVSLLSHPMLNAVWLRERIVADPSLLGLGDLQLADEGRSRDGRLEMLLHDPATSRRFTVLVRVGVAEETDLVRALEYWTLERIHHPQHEHFAVVVAERFASRFISAANTIGEAIPLSALQVSVLNVADHVALHIAPVLDRLPDRETDDANHRIEPRSSAHGPLTDAADVAIAASRRVETAPRPANGQHVSETTLQEQAAASLLRRLETLARENAAPAVAVAPQRRRGRPVFAFFSLVSLLLFMVLIVGWIRSAFARDTLSLIDGGGRQHIVYLDRGRIDWIKPDPGLGAGQRYVRIPYWLPVGITAILPALWLMRRRMRPQD